MTITKIQPFGAIINQANLVCAALILVAKPFDAFVLSLSGFEMFAIVQFYK